MTANDDFSRTLDRWRRAEADWGEYQRTHDVSHLDGQAVGVDPDAGEVFFGPTRQAITSRLEAEGKSRPLWFAQVGRPAARRHTRLRRL